MGNGTEFARARGYHIALRANMDSRERPGIKATRATVTQANLRIGFADKAAAKSATTTQAWADCQAAVADCPFPASNPPREHAR
jgi:hypothetical protein